MTIEVTLPGEPIAWARAGGGKTVHRFTPPKQRKYMATLRAEVERAMRGKPLMTGPIELSVLAVFAWPKSFSMKRRTAPGGKWKTSRPDFDNLEKLVDALNPKPARKTRAAMPPVIWMDDAQVASAHVWKQYGDQPRLVVKIAPLDPS